MSQPGVEFLGVEKRFGSVRALREFSLAVEAGEFLVLVGPSGCGKTTALRMVAGLEEPSDGVIRIGGVDATHLEPPKRDIAMVFQSYALYPHMTVRDNLAFGLKQRGTSKDEIAARVAEASAMLEIGQLLDRRPKELSGGQRQRVALGRAIVRRPKVFLMDEPLSNLDAQLRVHTRAEITALHRQLQTTVMYVTHDQVEAMTMGTRIAVLKDGVLQQVDTPHQLYERPANTFVATFIGSPAMNLIPGDATAGVGGVSFATAGGQVGLSAALSARLNGYRTATLGLRPEHFHRLPVAAGTDGALSGVVTGVEPLGSDQFVTLAAGPGAIVARLDPAASIAVGEHLAVLPEVDRGLLFDSSDGTRLG